MERAEASIIVGASVGEVYTVWRQFDNFPRFMNNVKEVTKKDGEGNLSHWKVEGPFGLPVNFDAEMTTDEPNKRIAWNSRGEGTVTTSGQVTFTELGTGQTQIHAIINWTPPAGKVGEVVAKVTANPQSQLEEDLGRFKEMIEGGKFGQVVPQT
ncbi:MAG TPA: SRPBCC family protein [Herpetosiphonaceae bacterium]|nr:SRPBCC family protein [Herpetosiphonaceae bacterium]